MSGSSPGFFGGTGNEAVTNPEITETLTWDQEEDLGLSSQTAQLDLTKGNKIKYTLDASATLTFVDPQGPSNLVIRFIQDSTGGHTVTFPAKVKWPLGIAPTLTTSPNAIDIVGLYFDGADYYGGVSYNYL